MQLVQAVPMSCFFTMSLLWTEAESRQSGMALMLWDDEYVNP
jgi:hypothetical protein